MIAHYRIPVRDPDRPALAPSVPSGARRRLLRMRGRRHVGERRLAYLDSHFPWRHSGFRYNEARAFLELRPDTLFFSTWELTDPFPARVHPLADFPRVALAAGITDVYAPFQLFLEGLCGLRPPENGRTPHPIEGPNLSQFLRDEGIRVHGCVYPGGGFVDTPEGYERVDALAARLDTLLTYVPEILERVPGAVEIPQALSDPRFYRHSYSRWDEPSPTVCLFAADSPPRKGNDVALEAFAGMDDRFHLHVVGPHSHRAGELPAGRATFHGWLSPDALRDLHRSVHVFLSPVRAEAPGPPGSFEGVTDGFPTVAATDAMCSGCLLVSANPARDDRVLQPDVHYVEVPAEAAAIRAALERVAASPHPAREIADRGSAVVRERMDIRDGVAAKLAAMGLD